MSEWWDVDRERPTPVIVPHTELSAEALRGVVEPSATPPTRQRIGGLLPARAATVLGRLRHQYLLARASV
jgi:hypothetical protein